MRNESWFRAGSWPHQLRLRRLRFARVKHPYAWKQLLPKREGTTVRGTYRYNRVRDLPLAVMNLPVWRRLEST